MKDDYKWCDSIESIAIIVDNDLIIQYGNRFAKYFLETDTLIGLSIEDFVDTKNIPRLGRINCYINIKKTGDRYFLFVSPCGENRWLVLLQRPEMKIDPQNDKYKIISSLGNGGTSIVHKCMSVQDGKKYAMKIIEKEKLKYDSVLLRRIQNEIRILKKIDHKHIIRLIETWENEKNIVIVMELGEEELFNKIVSSPLSYLGEKTARKYFNQVLDAVEYLHKQGIIHRDIKPENIVLINNEIKLIDFGLAKNLRANKYKRNSICGTLDYMAPEMVNRSGNYDYAADIWSLGILLYAMLYGRYPFIGSNPTEISRNIKRGKIDTEFPEYSATSSIVRDLMNSMIETDVKKRITIEQIRLHPWLNEAPKYRIGKFII